MMLTDTLKKMVEGAHLSEEEATLSMREIMSGEATPSQIAGWVTALRMKGETVDEITGLAKVMRAHSSRISPKVERCVDTCGTGGDNSHSFNISTTAAFVVAGAGVAVAKHGNRSVTSKSGSADVLEALDLFIGLTPAQVEASIETTGMGFLFAPSFHPSMKFAALPRKELGIRTVFNILGPLTNPAAAQGQVLGVFNERYADLIAGVLCRLGVDRAMVVHGSDGLDEVTITGSTLVFRVENGRCEKTELTPEHFGLRIAPGSELKGGDAATNAGILLSLLKGEQGPKRDVVLMNAACAIWAGRKADTLEDAYALALHSIDSSAALQKLEQLRDFTQKCKAGEG